MSALCAGFIASCDETPNQDQPEDPTVVGVTPVEVSDEVTTFFDENLWQIVGAIPFSEQGWGEPPVKPDQCLMFNSIEEFQRIDFPKEVYAKLPDIDFDSHTLIIGKHGSWHGGIYLRRQAIVVEPETIIMNIWLGEREGIHPQVASAKFFWGLYEKLPKFPIHVDVVFEK